MTKNENASIAEPEVVIFNDGLLKKSLNKSGSSITEWKSFMVCHHFILFDMFFKLNNNNLIIYTLVSQNF